MTTSLDDELRFYRTPGPLTDLGDLAGELRSLPNSLAELVEMVQGLLVHIHWAEAYGLKSTREEEVQIRKASSTLRRALEIDSSPLPVARPVDRRVFGNCRHFSTVLAALLRHQGVPARARCGFGRYFEEREVDHWICEVWQADEARWRRVDAQLDALQRDALKLAFDPLDLPEDAFWDAGRALKACRSGEADPKNFGILDMWGSWFVESNLVRDIASLGKLELLPWDDWGLMRVSDEARPGEEEALLQRAAALAAGPEARLSDVRALHDLADFAVPDVIRSWRPDGPISVEWSKAP